MNIKDILSDNTHVLPPIFVDEYYGSIYKKTEKIVCAVFILTDMQKDTKDIEDICHDVRNIAKEALKEIIELTAAVQHASVQDVATHTRTLMNLRSLLHVLVSVRIVRAELADILVREIDMVVQNIFSLYRERNQPVSDIDAEPSYTTRGKAAKLVRPRAAQGPVDGTGRYNKAPVVLGMPTTERRERVLQVIRAKGSVRIKDISDTIPEYSEKTIQRDLLDMIRDGAIVREGERRWSKYKLK